MFTQPCGTKKFEHNLRNNDVLMNLPLSKSTDAVGRRNRNRGLPFSSDGLAISLLSGSNGHGKCLVTVKEIFVCKEISL